MRVEYFIAWFLPLLAGAALCGLATAACGWRGRGATVAGSGWIAGLYLAACIASLVGRQDTLHVLANAAPWLAAMAAAGWLAVAARYVAWRRAGGVAPAAEPPPASWQRVAWWLLLAVLLSRLALLGGEAALRPVFPWDAWSAWALKPKSWILLGHVEPYVPMLDWLADPYAATRTAATWNYPELLAWIEVWFASGAGSWNEPLVNLAWSGALAAFLLSAYGHWRGIGIGPLPALGLAFALGSLPLLDAHVALAGYADLWIALTLGLALLAWSRWLLLRERGQWLLAIAFAACLPAIKLEGAIWLALFCAIVAWERLPARWRWWTVAVVPAMFVLAVALGLSHLPLPGAGWLQSGWGGARFAAAPPLEFGWHPVGGAMLASLFALPNWHLLWYALPLLVVLRWRFLAHDRPARLLGLFVLLQGLALFVLFFCTNAGDWAADFTSANRLILQLVPGVFVFVAVLLRDLPGVAARGSPTEVQARQSR